jgi:glycosyltransferase involved in cell wall biosynthesis
MSRGKSLLYFCPGAIGGIADYARYQIRALAELGVKVTLLTNNQWRRDADETYAVLPLLGGPRLFPSSYKYVRRLDTAFGYLRACQVLTSKVNREKVDKVLLASFVEYLAPLWSWKLVRLMKNGVKFAAIAHDPVRDYTVGPQWWHQWSISCGYSFLTEVFVHENIKLETFRPMPGLRTTVIPFGAYPFAPPSLSRQMARQKYQLADNARVLLAFGHIRDGKNLDLVLRAMQKFSDLYLVVAGKPQSAAQRPVRFYQSLAAELGLAERCRWVCDYIPEGEVGNLFQASDMAVLCYSRDFRSASSALNVAVHYRKPCLASSGQGNLKSMVSGYALGVWVEPDSIESLVEGLQLWRSGLATPRWEAYENDNSWRKNAEIVADRMNLLH